MDELTPKFPIIESNYSPEAVDRYIAQQAEKIAKYEQKFRELFGAYSQLKEQYEKDRLRVGDVLMDANQKATEIVEKAKAESEILLADVKREADRIKTAAVVEAAELKKQLDVEFIAVRDTFDKISAATESSRQDYLEMLNKVDTNTRNASSILHIWQQNTSTAVANFAAHASASGDKDYLSLMNKILQDVTPPENMDKSPPNTSDD